MYYEGNGVTARVHRLVGLQITTGKENYTRGGDGDAKAGKGRAAEQEQCAGQYLLLNGLQHFTQLGTHQLIQIRSFTQESDDITLKADDRYDHY